MISLAKLSIKHPKSMLAAWFVLAAALTVIGLGVSKTLSPSITVVPGTQSSRAQELAGAQFGPTQLVPILLEGPKAQLDRQGPALVIKLTRRPHTRVLSAWDAGTASTGLRPRSTAAMIVVSVDRPEADVVKYDQPQIESLVSRQISTPVKSYITGQPSIDRGVKTAALANLRQTELIAAGIVFLLLVIGLRAPVAAVIVTAVGSFTMLAGFGEVALLGHMIKLDPLGVALGTMTGLALGVGFALLILDRFHREELAPGAAPRDAATAAVRDLQTTGRAVLVGGTAVVLALLLAAIIGPTDLMVSLGTGMTTCAMFAIGGAVVVMPAALVLLGHRINWLRFPAPAPVARAWSRLLSGGNWVTRRAVLIGFAATAILATIAVPALSLDTGPPGVSGMLPSGSKARVAYEEISRVMGPGFATPYNVVVVARDRPITDPKMLASINTFQRAIARDETVLSVTGPGTINSTSRQLMRFGPSMKNSVGVTKKSKKDLLRLIDGLGQAGAGSTQLQTGLQQAVAGASALHSGSGQAHSGSAQLHAGLEQARAGSTKLSGGLDQALAGAQALQTGAIQLRNGSGQALSGASQIAAGLGQAAPAVKNGLPAVGKMASAAVAAVNQDKSAQEQAQATATAATTALTALNAMTTGKGDPEYQSVVGALAQARSSAEAVNGTLSSAIANAGTAALVGAGLNTQVNTLSPGLSKLSAGAAQLEAGLAQLRNGNARLAAGIGQLAGGMGRLSSGGGQLTSGLGQLTAGAGQLETGLAALENGTGQLASGLAPAPAGAGQLATGIGMMQAGVIKSRGQIPSTKDLEKLMRQSPGMFSSGYFVLAAVEGAKTADRNAATFALNLLRGGTAAQIVVVSKYANTDPRTVALGTQLADSAQAFGKHSNAEVAIGGPAGNLGDMTSVTRSRLWVDVAVIAAAIVLVLALALRALVLPAVATAFSLLVAGSTFGILELLFGGSEPLLGGPGYIDPMTIIGIFTVVFGITVVFSTLLLMRSREAFVAGEGTRQAVRTGLRETAASATGAGIVMAAAIVPFLTSGILNVREFGIGVIIAVLLDVIVVRPVLLPAAEAVLGRAGWWPTAPGEGTPKKTIQPARGLHLPRLRVRPGAAH